MTFKAARRVESVCVTEWDKHGHVVMTSSFVLFFKEINTFIK